MPGGRPSKYDPAFCNEVEDFMGQGFSRIAAAGHIGVCYDTLTNWMESHPEFFHAVKRGQAKRAIFLERGLLAAETGPQVTSRIFALKNAAPDEWKDKHEVDHKGGLTISLEADVRDL
jgi:hypothetical protein